MQDAEPPQIAVSGRNVYVLWHEFPTAASAVPDVFFARERQPGQTFSARMNLSDSANEDSRDEDMAISDGDIYVVWSEAGDIKLRKSTDNGAGFEPAKQLNSSTVNAFGPQIKIDDSDVYVVWSAEPAAGAPTEIFLAHSDDGKNFDAETNVSNTAGNSLAPQVALWAIGSSSPGRMTRTRERSRNLLRPEHVARPVAPHRPRPVGGRRARTVRTRAGLRVVTTAAPVMVPLPARTGCGLGTVARPRGDDHLSVAALAAKVGVDHSPAR